jgi:glutamine synthetase
MTPKQVLEFAEKNSVKIVDIRFTDLPGLWHHISFPIKALEESSFEEGFGIDGSSIRGWAAIHESDMLLVPDPTTALIDPFRDAPTLIMIGDIIDPITKQQYPRDPRFIARKAEAYLGFTGIADTAHFGAEPEFFILAARSATWATGRATKRGISPCRPPTTTRTCGRKLRCRWSAAGWRSNATTTK